MTNPDVTVVICTYNRCDLLPRAIESVLDQDTKGIRHEIVVVDNNSTDGTAAVIREFERKADGQLRGCFEPLQGLSYARNKGIRSSGAPIVGFTDDDVRAAKDWVFSIHRSFCEYPQAWFAGGKILPLWARTPERWLTAELAPVGLQDRGESIQHSNLENRMMLIGGNIAFRREVFDRVGFFSPDLQRVKNGIGSMEDQEFLTRIWKSGGAGVYDPRIQVAAEVTEERMTKDYHRRWHQGFGYYNAIYRDDVLETDGVRLFDVPGHLYRHAARDLLKVLWYRLRHDERSGFGCECRLNFFTRYFRQRRSDFKKTSNRGDVSDMLRCARDLLLRN